MAHVWWSFSSVGRRFLFRVLRNDVSVLVVAQVEGAAAHAVKGTGGSHAVTYLLQHIEDTENARLPVAHLAASGLPEGPPEDGA